MLVNSKICAFVACATILSIQSVLYAGSTMKTPTPKDKCPVCGMFVSGYQNWLVSVSHKNGTIAFFDGPKDMFTYYLNPGKYSPVVKQSDITDIMVKDYYTLKPFDARKAYFVTGSNVLGPMGKELIPLAKKSDAQEFLTDHKGNRIYRFKEVTAETLKSLE